MIHVKVICYVNVENHFLTFTKHSTFTRIMLGMPLREAFKKEVIFITFFLGGSLLSLSNDDFLATQKIYYEGKPSKKNTIFYDIKSKGG